MYRSVEGGSGGAREERRKRRGGVAPRALLCDLRRRGQRLIVKQRMFSVGLIMFCVCVWCGICANVALLVLKVVPLLSTPTYSRLSEWKEFGLVR